MADITELTYIGLVFGLFVIPRVLQAWRIPRAITALALGALAGLGFHQFQSDPTVSLFATLGISTLFLFAGLEVRLDELWTNRRMLIVHIVSQMVILAVSAWAAQRLFGLPYRASLLVALALLTPSAGFILDSLAHFGLSTSQAFWVRSMTIASEVVSLLVLFFVLQSSSLSRFALGTGALVVLVALLPWAFSLFARFLAPLAPRSEFAFLIMMTIGAAFVTRQLGAYYLVGAFVVGIVAQRFRERMPAMASEQMLHAVDVFASFFIPFYFFSAGLHLQHEQFTVWALAAGAGFFAVFVPLRVALAMGHTRWSLGTPAQEGWRMGTSLVPTLVFTLVIAEILRDRFGVADWLFGGLVIYALTNTMVPGLLLRQPSPELDDPDLPRWHYEEPSSSALGEAGPGQTALAGRGPRRSRYSTMNQCRYQRRRSRPTPRATAAMTVRGLLAENGLTGRVRRVWRDGQAATGDRSGHHGTSASR
ncbi:MAG: cation:proton antiporter [Vicinamibacterales bacterium]